MISHPWLSDPPIAPPPTLHYNKPLIAHQSSLTASVPSPQPPCQSPPRLLLEVGATRKEACGQVMYKGGFLQQGRNSFSELCAIYAQTQITLYFRQMESVSTNSRSMFDVVEQKLGLLAHSRLHTNPYSPHQRLEERLSQAERKLTDETAAKDAQVGEARLKMKRMAEAAGQLEAKQAAARRERSELLGQMRRELAQFGAQEERGRSEVEAWAPAAFETGTREAERGVALMREERKKQVNLCNGGLGAVLPEFREELFAVVRRQEMVLGGRVEAVERGSGELKEEVRGQGQRREGGERKLMEQLRVTVGEIKQMVTGERRSLEQNREKLFSMIEQAQKGFQGGPLPAE